jgi:isopenicillin N synthase-like dioxygenase
MFVDESGVDLNPHHFKILEELETSPDPNAGLYIRARSGKMVKVAIPKYCLAFQTGEGKTTRERKLTIALEIATAGKLRAVPHLVRASDIKGIARNVLAVFIQNDLEDQLGVSNETFAQFASRTLDNNLAS